MLVALAKVLLVCLLAGLSVLPVRPLNGEGLEIGVHRLAHGGEKTLLAEAIEESETLQLVLDRVHYLGEAELDAQRVLLAGGP